MSRSVTVSDLFDFEWEVDQHGYVLHDEPTVLVRLLNIMHKKTGLDPASWPDLDPASWEKIVRGCGGPPRYYRPMERPGLWRRFADTVTTPASALEFVREFGLLTEFEIRPARGLRFGDKFDPFDTLRNENTVDFVLNFARGLREISHALDSGERHLAAMLFSRFRPPMTATINLSKRGGQRLDLNIVPSDLRSALYLQAGNAITGDLKFRRCLNCPDWFQIGSGAHTERRKFCSDRCRVAWSRKPTKVQVAG